LKKMQYSLTTRGVSWTPSGGFLVLSQKHKFNAQGFYTDRTAELLRGDSRLLLCAIVPDAERFGKRLNVAAGIEHRKFVGIVARPLPQELFHKRGLSSVAATGNDDRFPFPCNHPGVHEEPPRSSRRNVEIHV